MSSTLVWTPVDSRSRELKAELKDVLRKKYGNPVHATLTTSDILYLEGLRDGGNLKLSKLIKAIEEYGEIIVEERW